MIVFKVEHGAILGITEKPENYELGESEYVPQIFKDGDRAILKIGNDISHIGDGKPDSADGLERKSNHVSREISDLANITAIEISASVKTIKSGFFSQFPNLNEIIFPEESKIERIFPMAFSDCNKIKELVIPNNVDGKEVQIDVDAFTYCYDLRKIETPENSNIVLSIKNAFYGCDKIEEVLLKGRAMKYSPQIRITSYTPRYERENDVISHGLSNDGSVIEPLTELEYDMIRGSQIRRIVIPQGVTSIRDYCFYLLKNLEEVEIPQSTTRIGSGAFNYCSNLKYVNIPDGVTEIEDSTFEECSNIQHIFLPPKLACIGDKAFKGCEALISITMPHTVMHMGEHAFSGCTSLCSVQLSENISHIKIGTFRNCKSLVELIIPENVVKLDTYIFDGCTSLEKVLILGEVKKLRDNTFKNCTALRKVQLPEGLERISGECFLNCGELVEINIPSSVSVIEPNAFKGCKKISKTNIPISVIHASSIKPIAFNVPAKEKKEAKEQCEKALPGAEAVEQREKAVQEKYIEKSDNSRLSAEQAEAFAEERRRRIVIYVNPNVPNNPDEDDDFEI